MSALPSRTQSRHRRLVGVLAAAALLVSACGGGSDEAESSAAAGEGFPRTVETLSGPVTIKAKPERVVALTVAAAEALSALGTTPIAIAADPATVTTNFPWLPPELSDLATDLEGQRFAPNVEAIAALRPDLIVAPTVAVRGKPDMAEKLSAIAPLITPNVDAGNVDWTQRLKSTADALNETEEADRIIDEIKNKYAAVGSEVPGIDTKTYQWVAFNGTQFQFGNGSLFELFGLKAGPLQDNTQNGSPLSVEETGQLSADLLAVFPRADKNRTQLEENPLFQGLPSVKNGSMYMASLATANALNSPGPLSLDWFLTEITPTVQALAK